MPVSEARVFAESVAGMLDRGGVDGPQLTGLLDDLGWATLPEDEGLIACAGLGAVELGRRLAPVHQLDRLLGGAPMAGDLVRSLGADRLAATGQQLVPVVRSEPAAYADGLDVHRVLQSGDAVAEVSRAALRVWTAASVGYLAGLGEGARDLTVEYVRERRAFGTTLAALAPVQQLLADADTAVTGVRLLAGEGPDRDALAHAGPAIAAACAACQQVTGAIGFTLEYQLHRYTQRARALAAWGDALLD